MVKRDAVDEKEELVMGVRVSSNVKYLFKILKNFTELEIKKLISASYKQNARIIWIAK